MAAASARLPAGSSRALVAVQKPYSAATLITASCAQSLAIAAQLTSGVPW
jgi:hypothetical protein